MRLIDVDHFKERLLQRIKGIETNPLYTDAEKCMAWDIFTFVLSELTEKETITKAEEK